MWEPATKEYVESLVAEEAERLPPDLRLAWDERRVPTRRAAIRRDGSTERVFVVAEHDGHAMYFEDVEEGFNVSPLGPEGEILAHGCEQDDLDVALRKWLALEGAA